MAMSWHTEANRIACRWSEVGERVQYNPPWIQDVPRGASRDNFSSSGVDFVRLSPFGGGDWYALIPPRIT
jgi:hypothetical protein